MKNLLVLLTVIAICLTNGEKLAADEPKKLELHPAKPYLITDLALIPVWVIQINLIHEAGHALMALSTGATVKNFRPYPHMEPVPEGTRFVMASTRIGLDNLSFKDALILTAPLINDVLMFMAADLILSKIDRRSPAAPLIYAAGMVAPLINFALGSICLDGSDCGVVATEIAHAPRWPFIVTGQLIVGVGVWRAVVRFQEIFLRYRSTSTKTAHQNKIRLRPLVSPQTLGITGSF